MTVFALVKSPELLVETMLGFHGDGDDGRGLTLAASFQDQVGATSVTVIPGGFDQQSSGMDIPGFGDGALSFFVTRGAF
jgi:hypothetical protein